MMTKRTATAFGLIGESFRFWWDDWANGVLISLAMLLTSLTLILSGPAFLGVCVVAADLADGVRTGIGGWWAGFKRYFWQGILWSVTNILLAGVSGISLWFYTQWSSPWAPVLALVLLAIAVFWIFMQFLTPGYLIEQSDKSLGLAWKNSLLTLLAAPGFGVVVGLFSLVISILSLATIMPIILGTGWLLALLSVLVVRDRLAYFQVWEREDAA